MGCLKYEFIKLGKKRTFLIMCVLLLAANLLAFYMSEKPTSEFSLVFEQRENYDAYLDGDKKADVNNYYSQDTAAQATYIASYPDFISGMADRVEQMGRISIFADKDSYNYRNMIKTCADFEKFTGVDLQADNCFGIRSFARYHTGVLFTLVFLAILTYYVVFFERGRNLMLLIKGTRRGQLPTAFSKLAVILSVTVVYTLIQESLVIYMAGSMYGYGDMDRLIQSVSEFRNCIYMLTVREALSAILLIRTALAVFFACIFFCTAMFIKNEAVAAGLSAAVLGLLFLAKQIFSVSSSFDWLACVNPFYCWDMEQMLGEYHNLNLAGQPVGKEFCAAFIGFLFIIVLSLLGALAFSRTCQTRSESRLEGFMQYLRRRTSFLNRRTSLLYYEFYKMMIQQKKGILLVFLLLFSFRESCNVFETQYYPTAQAAAYHYYMDQYQGRITDEKLEAIQKESQEISALSAELFSLGENPEGADKLRKLTLETELEKKESGFYQIEFQIQSLKEKPGSIYDKYLVDEMDYNELWNDTDTDVTLWLIGSILLILFLSGIRTMDEKRGMTGLLRTARAGREKLDHSRTLYAVLCTAIVFLCMEFPLFLSYCRAGCFHSAGQLLSDFTLRSFRSSLPLVLFIAIVFFLKLLAFSAVCFLCLRAVRALKSELPVLLACSGIAAVTAVVLYRLTMDIEMGLIYIL